MSCEPRTLKHVQQKWEPVLRKRHAQTVVIWCANRAGPACSRGREGWGSALASGTAWMRREYLGSARLARAKVIREAGDCLARRNGEQQEETELRHVERISDVEAELGREQEIGCGKPADE